MARIRSIKPETWTDEKFVELQPLARLLFIGLWNFCDDEGRMPYSPTRIKLQILPADSIDCSALLEEIRGKSMICIYEVEGIEYLQIVKFEKHQKVDKRTPSKLPPAPKATPNSAESPRRIKEGKGSRKGSRSGGDQGVEGIKETPQVKSVAAASRLPTKSNGNGETKSAPAWQAFTEAYRERYHTDPTHNAVENAAMAAFVELVPLAEAPAIAAFYVRHNKPWYVTHQHSVKYLRQDAAGLRTQWLNGRNVTDTEARQADRTQATGDQAERLIAESRKVA